MLSLTDLIWVAAAAAIGNYWWRSRRFKDQALALAAARCRKLGLQFLDQSVVLILVRPDQRKLRRTYQFEFTSTGEQRYRGVVVLSGHNLISLELEPHIMPQGSSPHSEQ